jgi:hypothetical protein
MKKLVILLLLINFALWFELREKTVFAQTPQVGSMAAPQMVSTLAQCGPLPGATISFGAIFCFVDTNTPATDKMYVSEDNGKTWFQWPAPTTATGGVASFNGRTGNVLLTKSDVISTGLTATVTVTPPTASTTATTTVNAPPATVTLQ